MGALEVWRSSGRQHDQQLGEGIVTGGRRVGSTIMFHDPRCSNCHLTFDRIDGVDTVTDLSSNGTYVNGVRLTKAEVRTNALCYLSRTRLA